MARRNPFPYVIEDRDRHGNIRVYYRSPKADKKIRIWVSKEHPKFIEHYQAAKIGKPLPKPSTSAPAPGKAEEGTLAALVQAYAKSAKFKSVNPLGRKTRLAILESCCAEIAPQSGKPMGQVPVRFITPKHIQFLQDQKGDLPGAANNRIKYLRILFGWAYKGTGQANPAKAIDMLPPRRKDGHHAWTLAEVAAYERRHPIGTTARLALDLALYTAARRSDLVTLGPANVADDGWLSFTQSKTGGIVEIPVIEQLAASIAASRIDKTFLITGHGKPYTVDGFGNAFRRWCDAAGLPNCAIHGLRKAAASKLAELGASGEQIKAITGHATDHEVRRYTASARRRIMAESAIELLRKSLMEKSHLLEPSENGGTSTEEEGG